MGITNKIKEKISQKVKIKKKRFYFLIFLFVFIFNIGGIVSFAAATPSTPRISTSSDLEKGLSDDENEEIADFIELKNMVASIFEIKDNKGTDILSNPIQLSYDLICKIIKWYDDIIHTSPYKALVGLGLIFLVANFSVSVYEDTNIGINTSIKTANMRRKFIRFIFAFLLIVFLHSICLFILGFFRFFLKFMVESTENNFIDEVENIESVINPERVAYEILRENGIVKGETLLDDVIVRSKESAVRSSFMIPWIFSWVSKMALLVVVFMNSISLFIHSIFYVVSIGDFFSNLQKSKFIEYSKTLFSIALNEVVIILVLYLCNLTINPYLKELLREGVVGDNISFINLAMIFTGIQLSRVLVLISTMVISKKIVGVA